MEIDVATPGVSPEPLVIGGGIQIRLSNGTTIGLMGVAPHDFGAGPAVAAMVMVTEPGAAAQRGWVGLGSSVRAGGLLWTVSDIDVKSPTIVLQPPPGALKLVGGR